MYRILKITDFFFCGSPSSLQDDEKMYDIRCNEWKSKIYVYMYIYGT